MLRLVLLVSLWDFLQLEVLQPHVVVSPWLERRLAQLPAKMDGDFLQKLPADGKGLTDYFQFRKFYVCRTKSQCLPGFQLVDFPRQRSELVFRLHLRQSIRPRAHLHFLNRVEYNNSLLTRVPSF